MYVVLYSVVLFLGVFFETKNNDQHLPNCALCSATGLSLVEAAVSR